MPDGPAWIETVRQSWFAVWDSLSGCRLKNAFLGRTQHPEKRWKKGMSTVTARWEAFINGFHRTKLCFCAGCLLVYLFLIRVSGAGLGGLLIFAACVLLYLYLPGRFWTFCMGMDHALWGFGAPMGILLGTGFLAAAYCVCMRLGLLWVLRAVPPALGLFWLLFLQRPRGALRAVRARLRDGAFLTQAALWAGMLVLFACLVSVKNAHPAAAGEIVLTQDMMWNIGSANSFLIAFPPQDIRFSMVRFSYHYLTELVLGALSLVSGVSCYDIYVFYAAPLQLAALLCCLNALGRCFYREKPDKAFCFPFLLLLFNCASLWTALKNGVGSFHNTHWMHLITNINAQGTAVIFISIFSILFFEMARRAFRVTWRWLLVFCGAFVLVCFSKGPEAAIVACSFVITMLFLLFRRPCWSRALPALLAVPAIFVLVYSVVFSSGTNTSVHFGARTIGHSLPAQWLGGLLGQDFVERVPCLVLLALLLVFCMQPLQLVLYLRGLGKDIRGIFHLPAERLYANGIVAGGFLAYFLFWHPSYSQLYFALLAILFLNLLAADQIGAARARPAKALTAVCGVIGLATTVILTINFTGSGMRQLARNLDLIPKYPYVSTARAGDEAAMLWLRDNTPQNAVFATNRIHSMANVDDGISSLYSAMSGRQAYMEGYTYAVTNMGVSEAVVAEKQAVNSALFRADTPPERIIQLCGENNIDYLVFSKQYPGDTSQLAGFAVAYENDDAAIYAVHP